MKEQRCCHYRARKEYSIKQVSAMLQVKENKSAEPGGIVLFKEKMNLPYALEYSC